MDLSGYVCSKDTLCFDSYWLFTSPHSIINLVSDMRPTACGTAYWRPLGDGEGRQVNKRDAFWSFFYQGGWSPAPSPLITPAVGSHLECDPTESTLLHLRNSHVSWSQFFNNHVSGGSSKMLCSEIFSLVLINEC